MKQKFNLTNWKEVIDYTVSKSEFGWKTKESCIKTLQENMLEKIYDLWDEGKLVTNKWDDCVWDDEVNDEYKEYFELENKFNKNAIVEEKDYSSTDYELKKKYGQDWYDENYEQTNISIKNNLSIDQLESLASLMKEGYYDFWHYETNKKGFIIPYFHQYSTSEYSEYIHDQRKLENFELELEQQKSSKTQKLTM